MSIEPIQPIQPIQPIVKILNPEMNYKYLIYHAKCADGVRCAQILKKLYPELICLGEHPGTLFNVIGDENISVICVDIIFIEEQLNEFSKFKHVLIIDHHSGNKELLTLYSTISSFEIIFDEERAACHIIEDLFIGKRSLITQHIGYRDLYKLDEIPYCREVNASLYLNSETYYVEKSLRTLYLKSTYDRNIPNYIEEGKILLKLQSYQIYEDVKKAEQCVLTTPLGYYNVWTVFSRRNPNEVCNYLCNVPFNIESVDSSADAINIPDFAIMIYYNYKEKLWEFSMRSNSIDISEIAKSMGGGGHTLASKFKSPCISFLNFVSKSKNPRKPSDLEEVNNSYFKIVKENSNLYKKWKSREKNFLIANNYFRETDPTSLLNNIIDIESLKYIYSFYTFSNSSIKITISEVIGYICKLENRLIYKITIKKQSKTSEEFVLCKSTMSLDDIQSLFD